MGRYKGLLISIAILFLLVNTAYYWRGSLGGWDMLIILLCVLSFVVLSVTLIRQLYLIIKERFKDKARVYLCIIMTILLGAIALKPFGLIDLEKFGSKDLLIGWQKGIASCTFTLKLKENNEFYIRTICFGDTKVWGRYTIKNDTIKLTFTEPIKRIKLYEFGIYKPLPHPHDKIIGEIKLFTSKKDTMPFPLVVYENKLIK